MEYVDFTYSLLSDGINFLENEPLSKHSSFRIGGPAKIIVLPRNKTQLIDVLDKIKKANTKYSIIGNGSNILFDDDGYDGVIVSTKNMRQITINDNLLYADCGASFTSMALAAYRESLSGLEFAYGIPGSCGGAVFMNAGAYGSETSAVLDEVACYDVCSGKIINLQIDQINMSYRYSTFMEHPELIILSALFKLKRNNKEAIHAIMEYNKSQRQQKQPLEYPNAGSIFKRHKDYFIGKIIEDCGLKGYSIGGAQVSEKHAGFIINVGGATSSDVLDLISHIKDVVLNSCNFELECEIRYIK